MVKAKYNIPGGIVIPTAIVNPNFKVEITADDSTVYDVTSDLIDLNVILSGTNELSSFTASIFNNKGEYTGLFDGGETVEIYFDYASATNLYLRGRIDKYFYSLDEGSGFTLNIGGRNYPQIADDTKTISFVNATVVEGFIGTEGTQDAQGNYEDGVLYETGLTWHPSNPATSTIRTTKSFEDSDYLSIFSHLAIKGGYDWYIYYDSGTWYLRLFTEGSVTNTAESVSYGNNLLSVQEIGKDYDDEINNVRIYGKEDSNIIYVDTAENTTSQTNLWKKSKRINDTTIDSATAISEKATLEINNNVAVQKGSIITFGLPTLKAGEAINIMVPNCNMNGVYVIKRIATSINSNGVTSSLDIERTSESIATFFKENLDATANLQPFINLNDMNYSRVIDFTEEDSGTHSNTQVSNSKLKLIDTSSNGTWISDGYSMDNNFTDIELRIKSNYDIDECIFYVSNNNGETWTVVDYGTLYTLTSEGKTLKIKIDFITSTDNPYPQFEKICCLFK